LLPAPNRPTASIFIKKADANIPKTFDSLFAHPKTGLPFYRLTLPSMVVLANNCIEFLKKVALVLFAAEIAYF
jgi:hypothetical protein